MMKTRIKQVGISITISTLAIGASILASALSA